MTSFAYIYIAHLFYFCIELYCTQCHLIVCIKPYKLKLQTKLRKDKVFLQGKDKDIQKWASSTEPRLAEYGQKKPYAEPTPIQCIVCWVHFDFWGSVTAHKRWLYVHWQSWVQRCTSGTAAGPALYRRFLYASDYVWKWRRKHRWAGDFYNPPHSLIRALITLSVGSMINPPKQDCSPGGSSPIFAVSTLIAFEQIIT